MPSQSEQTALFLLTLKVEPSNRLRPFMTNGVSRQMKQFSRSSEL